MSAGMIGAFFPDAETTDGVTVRVSVSYLPEQSEPGRGRWFWAYHIRIENDSDRTVQLLTRHWIITDGRGARHSVEGEGVVGEQPALPPGGSFTYDSFVTLEAAPGHMGGHYVMQDAWGARARVPIAPFILAEPGRTLNVCCACGAARRSAPSSSSWASWSTRLSGSTFASPSMSTATARVARCSFATLPCASRVASLRLERRSSLRQCHQMSAASFT